MRFEDIYNKKMKLYEQGLNSSPTAPQQTQQTQQPVQGQQPNTAAPTNQAQPNQAQPNQAQQGQLDLPNLLDWVSKHGNDQNLQRSLAQMKSNPNSNDALASIIQQMTAGQQQGV